MDRIVIQIDDRERTGMVFSVLEKSPEFEIAVVRLVRGDYLVDGRLLFERKTAPDLAASIVSGRLFMQVLRLTTSGARPILIVEGSNDELARTRKPQGQVHFFE